MNHNPNYLNETVYLRKGSQKVLAATEANRKDPNLVPMKVSEAIQLGYINDPMANTQVDPAEQQLHAENTRLRDLLTSAQNKQAQSDKALSQVQARLDELEALSENTVSVGHEIVTPVNEKITGEVIPPVANTDVVNMASDAGETGLEELENEHDESDLQADLDALVGSGAPT